MNRKESILLFLGDILIFILSLWLTLWVRYFELPSGDIFMQHLGPFAVLFVFWALIFFIAGLYEKRTLVIRRKLSASILNVQVINSIIAAAFFYFVPVFGITPKTNIIIYLVVSFVLIVVWRIFIAPMLGVRRAANALLVGSRGEMDEIRLAIKNNHWYNLNLVSSINLDKIENINFQKDLSDLIYGENVSVIIVDLKDEKVRPILSKFYNLMFSGVKFMSIHDVYEDIFGRIPLELIQYDWFLENISKSSHLFYDALKRLMDIVISLILFAVSLLFYPFVYLAIKLEDKGSIFIHQKRIGKGGREIEITKFRSMTADKFDSSKDHSNEITKVGKFLRKTNIDELPQLWGVLMGRQSLIGPRPELPELVRKYSQEISYYNIRHLHKPGLSGWAQIYHGSAPHHGTDIENTKVKLSYDLFYIKHHSLLLDLKIALKTVKALFFRKDS